MYKSMTVIPTLSMLSVAGFSYLFWYNIHTSVFTVFCVLRVCIHPHWYMLGRVCKYECVYMFVS